MHETVNLDTVPGATVPADVLPFAPILYVAWADGELSGDEIRESRDWLDAAKLAADTRQAIARWLDPEAPPSAEALRHLLNEIRRVAAAADGAPPTSLAELGEQLARAVGATRAVSRRVRRALDDAENALGIIGAEALRAVLPDIPDAAPESQPPSIDSAGLQAVLEAGHADIRSRVRAILASPEFAYVPDTDTAAYRARVYDWCHRLAGDGLGAIAFPREFGGDHDPARAIAVFETLAFHDISLLIKFGVQFGLFGGSIWMLGTRLHHERWLADVASLALPGCFAMTETGHGSNVRDIRTTATFDRAAGEFVIHSPDRSAWKDYIGNAAMHGRVATVFAQLETGGLHHGVHAFLVPIRNEEGEPMPGVTLEDCGRKVGLNGIDNGRIAFDHVRVPRDHLLNRFGNVAEDGTYTSSIASAGRRFFTMLGTLVNGRVAIATGALSVAKSGLTIAVRYTDRRRQFGPEGQAELPVLDYLAVQRSLMPRLASAFALDFALDDLVNRLVVRTDADAQEVEALAAGLKAWASTFALSTLQASRESCGGQGYMEVNRLGILRADVDVFTTFEGANDVLLQLVAKGLLTEYREQFGELRLWNVVRYVSGRAAVAITERNPIATRRTDPEHLRDPAFHLSALRYREARLTDTLARRLRHRIQAGLDSFAALNECQDHAIAAAVAFIERHIFECTRSAIESRASSDLRSPLDRLSALFALSVIERNAGWYLEKDYMEGAKAGAIREEVNRLCGEVRRDARSLVDAFGIPDALLAAPIAIG